MPIFGKESLMSHKRADRVGDLIKAELSRLVIRDVADPRIGNVTITDVKVTDDLQLARVFFVRFGEAGCSDETFEGLRGATGFFRREMAKILKLRRVPNLEFFFDASFDQGDRIEQLLADIEKEDSTNDGQDS